MIIVDIRVPALEKVYNFSVEEMAKVSDLIEEVVELVCQKEHLAFNGNLEEMVLCSVEGGVQCDRNKCLNDYGVTGGSELILM
ncbi:MAG: EsaB/YukD family protein [Oscillospiraceae bacterium]|nr:EsaB/YukD family protein [Oscillospiraceae bacterium]